MIVLHKKWKFSFWMWLCLWLFTTAHGQSTAAEMYRCPGNLFTNQIGPTQARQQGCEQVAPAGYSQVHLTNATSVAQNQSPDDASVTTVLAPDPLRVPEPNVASRRTAVANTHKFAEDVSVQRARDRDARWILERELSRTQARLASLLQPTGANPGVDDAAVQRLRADEAALRRELARLPL